MKFTSILRKVILEQSKYEILRAVTEPSTNKEGKKVKPKMTVDEYNALVAADPTTRTNNVDLATARERVLADIAKGQQPAKEGGAAITDAAVKMESRLKDVQAGIAQGVARPITEVVAPHVKRISDKYLSGNVTDKVKGESRAVATKFFGLGETSAPPPNETTSNAVLRNLRSSGDLVSNITQPTTTAPAEKSTAPATAAPASQQKTEKEKSEVVAPKATLDDVLESLKTLNNKIQNMSDHTEAIKDLTGKQVRATNGLSNDRFSH